MNVPRAFRDRVEFDPSFKAFPPSDPTEDDEPSTPVSPPPVRPDAARRSWRSDSDESGEGVQGGCMRDPSLPKIGKALMNFGPIAIRWVGIEWTRLLFDVSWDSSWPRSCWDHSAQRRRVPYRCACS